MLGVAALFASAIHAQQPEWPAKPITLLVPGGTGGVIDIRARWLAPRLSTLLGQPVVVENRAGAGGFTGTAAGAKAAPDGYTFVMVHQGTMAIAPHMKADLGYAPLRDFTPVTRVGFGSLALVVTPTLDVRSVDDLVKLMKSKPGTLNYGSPGVASPPHLASELFQLETGTKAAHIPYKGGGQAASDLIGGHVDFEIEGLQVMVPQILEGRVRALAVTGKQRVASIPNVPTMAEAGYPGSAYEGWVGIVAPAGTPAPIVKKMYDALSKVLLGPEGREFFAKAGAEAGADPPEAFAAIIKADYDRWAKLVPAMGLKAE